MVRYIDPFSTLAVTVMVLLNGPPANALKVALIKPEPPGGTGVLVQSGVVQPQEGCALTITKGTLPELVNLNSCVTGTPCLIFPKSNEEASQLKTATSTFASLLLHLALMYLCK